MKVFTMKVFTMKVFTVEFFTDVVFELAVIASRGIVIILTSMCAVCVFVYFNAVSIKKPNIALFALIAGSILGNITVILNEFFEKIIGDFKYKQMDRKERKAYSAAAIASDYTAGLTN